VAGPRGVLEKSIELAIGNLEVRTELNAALLLFKSNAAGATKRAAIAVLDKFGGCVEVRTEGVSTLAPVP
jgi:hypothetical protein